MRGPSLARRLVLAFLACFVVLAVAVTAVLTVFFEARYLGVNSAATELFADLRAAPDGGLALRPGAEVLNRRRGSPDLWFMVRGRDGRTLVEGRPPDDARRLLQAMPAPQTSGEDTLEFIAEDGDPALAQWDDTAAGPVSLVVGGVSTAAMTGGDWLILLLAVLTSALLPLLLLMLVLGLAIVPLVLGALRRLRTNAAALDGADLGRRLPEEGVVSELRPVVRAFNAALDRVQAAAQRRERLIGDIAHELRTPLAVLTLRSETLPESPATLEVRRGLGRLTQLIAQMLDAERLGAADRRREAVNLVELARAAVAEIAPLAVTEGDQLEFTTEAETVWVEGDRAAIGRAVSNLLGNAVTHAGGAGLIHVRVGTGGVIEVEDGGAGLAPGSHERVFEPFHRERWDKDGCGLGLHLVREVMRAHGGRAEAADGESGALFRLVFPAPASA